MEINKRRKPHKKDDQQNEVLFFLKQDKCNNTY